LKYVRDTTGRFSQRPHYEPEELDLECEQIIAEFIRERYHGLVLPIPTDALTKLIERDADDLDLYADLSSEGPSVQAVTEFYSGRRPRVRIAQDLSEQEHRSNRLRTTLTHEYGHVKFHAYLWDVEPQSPPFPNLPHTHSPKCKRETILNAPTSDWMEWQAGYICGALLMPISSLRRLVSRFFEEHNLSGPLREDAREALLLEHEVVKQFDVSQDAARVRLLKLHYLSS